MSLRSIAAAALAAALALGAVPVAGAVATPPTGTASTAPAVLRADFVQERWIDGFRHPLRSEGEVVLVHGEGLRWETRTPFPSVMIIRGERMLIRDREGREREMAENTGANLPALVHSLMGALLTGDRVALGQRFTVIEAPAPREGAWALALRPQERLLASLYVGIDVQGAEHVEQLVLRERSGARTTIRFANTQVAAIVGEAERRALD